MLAFILRKFLAVIPTFFGITLVAFTLIRLVPGDPIEVMVGERRLDPEIHAAMMQRMGLDQPLYLQYFKYVKDLLHGDWGCHWLRANRSSMSSWRCFRQLLN